MSASDNPTGTSEEVTEEVTSMIGNGQGETEISVDPAEQVPRAREWFQFLAVLDRLSGPTLWQRGQTSICGNNAE